MELLSQLLAIKSPTYHEQECMDFVKEWMSERISDCTFLESKQSLICEFPHQEGKPHIALVGHSDVVPEHVDPVIKNGKLYGSGASDMKGGVAAFMTILSDSYGAILKNYNVSLIVYAREEGTRLEENGLNDLIVTFPEYFKRLDLAIVGEPTDNQVQIGCVGSMHCKVTINGQSSHSARPWDGENALYKALPLIEKIAGINPKPQDIFGCTFYDVLQLTESHSEKGRTSLPGYWTANLNYRFSPNHSVQDAELTLHNLFKTCDIQGLEYTITDVVPPGKVIESDLFQHLTSKIDAAITAKQAWTDVAQLTGLGIPAFNFGPGQQTQAHQKDEYIEVSMYQDYMTHLRDLLIGE